MPSKNRLTLLLPEGVGLASKFSKAPRPFVRVKNGSLQDGDILLQLTLKQLVMIRRMSADTPGPYPELFQDAKVQYDVLLKELAKLDKVSQSTSLFNILKRLEIRRNTHALVEAGYELYITTKSTSDKLQRALLSHSSLVEEVEEGEIPTDELVKGFAIDMEDEEAASILTADPFSDPIAPDHDSGVTDPGVTPTLRGSAGSVYNFYFGCVNADSSDARVITMNNGGSDRPDNTIHHSPS